VGAGLSPARTSGDLSPRWPGEPGYWLDHNSGRGDIGHCQLPRWVRALVRFGQGRVRVPIHWYTALVGGVPGGVGAHHVSAWRSRTF
jgi:hypothetical protein